MLETNEKKEKEGDRGMRERKKVRAEGVFMSNGFTVQLLRSHRWQNEYDSHGQDMRGGEHCEFPLDQ